MSLDPTQRAIADQDAAAAAQLTRTLVRSAQLAAERVAAETDSAAEGKDWATAAFTLAQAITVLDPNRLAGGDTPEARAAATPVQGARDADGDGLKGEQ